MTATPCVLSVGNDMRKKANDIRQAQPVKVVQQFNTTVNFRKLAHQNHNYHMLSFKACFVFSLYSNLFISEQD